jgi:hypothetical protein
MNDFTISFPGKSAIIYSHLQLLEFGFNIKFSVSTYDNDDVWIDTIISVI